MRKLHNKTIAFSKVTFPPQDKYTRLSKKSQNSRIIKDKIHITYFKQHRYNTGAAHLEKKSHRGEIFPLKGEDRSKCCIVLAGRHRSPEGHFDGTTFANSIHLAILRMPPSTQTILFIHSFIDKRNTTKTTDNPNS